MFLFFKISSKSSDDPKLKKKKATLVLGFLCFKENKIIYFLRLVAKEAGDDDFGDMGCVGTAAAHTHHSEEVKFYSALAEEGEGNLGRKRKKKGVAKTKKKMERFFLYRS